jgi:uncharacterized membrane protein YjjP (DUF1212 family)
MGNCDAIGLSAAVARRVIENGGETYRAEELLLRTAHACGVRDADGFVTPTGIIASGTEVSPDGRAGQERSLVRRIDRRTLDLGEICRIEDIVRSFESGASSADDLRAGLDAQPAGPRYGLGLRIAAAALISGFFSLLFGGSAVDFGLALLVGPVVALISHLLDRADVPPYFANMAGAAIVVGLASLGAAFVPGATLETLTAGPLMLLVPGIAITNSVRDTIEGDLVAGLARGIEAFLLAAALAVGAGFSLKVADILAPWAR